jgi:hypothetical protein
VMQLYIRAWPSSAPEPSSVAKKWQKWGHLQSDIIQSPFFSIHVPELEGSEGCEGFREKHGIH